MAVVVAFMPAPATPRTYLPPWPGLNPLICLRRRAERHLPFPFNARHATPAYRARNALYPPHPRPSLRDAPVRGGIRPRK
jgi:hypothetical protein